MMTYENIPQELKEMKRWVNWRLDERDGKPTKIPVNPRTGGNAMANNPDTWGTFDAAIQRLSLGACAGVGFMLGDGVVGVDIDKCYDSLTLTEQARDIIETMDTYTEWSQSGKGIHIICKGQMPAGRKRNGSVEMYAEQRFFIMTGAIIDHEHAKIEERTSQLYQVYQKYFAGSKQEQTFQKKQKKSVFADEDEILKKALESKNNILFQSLLNGDWESYYSSQSEADMAFCNLLAFWCNGDLRMMDGIFRKSGMYRDKWDAKHGNSTYGEQTLKEAISRVSDGYKPPSPKENMDFQEQAFQALIDSENENSVEKTRDITSDLGRSRRFAERYKLNYLYCPDMKQWFKWTGTHYTSDRSMHVQEKAKDVIDEILIEAVRSKSEKLQKEILKAKDEKRIKSMVELAKSELAIMPEEFNADPWLLNCLNGTVNLQTGEILAHNQEHRISKITAANYSPGIKSKLFETFLDKVTIGDKALQNYFQEICGMAAIGKVFYEGLVICYGSGKNGKSTFLNSVAKSFGDYWCSVNPEMLMAQKDGKTPVGITALDGKRFATAVETEEGKRLSSMMLKRLASTDPITGRELYQNERTFIPSHTLLFATNFLPKVGSTDAGTWRRIAVVPFHAKFDGKGEIKNYADVLFAEDADFIITWVIEGARRYIKNNFHIEEPTAVTEATAEYRQNEDWLGNFVQDCCYVGSKYEESSGKLYEAYIEWTEKNNESYKRRPRDFAAGLENAGYEKRKGSTGNSWRGLKLIVEPEAAWKSKAWYEARQKEEVDEDGLTAYQRSIM